MYLCVIFVSYFVCVILCIFVFLCDILLPSGVINDDKSLQNFQRHGTSRSLFATTDLLAKLTIINCHFTSASGSGITDLIVTRAASATAELLVTSM